MTVGERIKQRRIELGLNQSELAELMGYSGKSSICKAETGGDSVTTRTIERFAKALKTTPRHLMGWDTEEIITDAPFVSVSALLVKDNLLGIIADFDENQLNALIKYAKLIARGDL